MVASARIPKERYFSREYTELERERLWPRVWLLACHVGEIAEPGTFRVLDVGRESVVVVRGADGAVRAFHNVCQHRGNRLCTSASGAGDTLRCPYHHWSWNLDGSLKRMSRPEQFPGVASDELRLAGVRCEVRHGFAWVNLDGRAPGIDDFLGELAGPLAAYRPAEYAHVLAQTVEIACNWKLSADVSNEAYHLRTLHAEMMQILDDTAIGFTRFGLHSRITVPLGMPSRRSPFEGRVTDMMRGFLARESVDARGIESVDQARAALVAGAVRRAAADRLERGALTEEQCVDKHQLYVFPNVQLNFTMRTLEIYRHRPHPADPEIMLFDEEALERRPPGAQKPSLTRRAFRHGERPLGPVMQQDVDLLPGLQRGMRSSGFEGLLLAEQEEAIAHMHEGLDRYLEAP